MTSWSRTWKDRPKTNSGYLFYNPGSIRVPNSGIPKGWIFEFRAGVNEYQRMQGHILLRIREVGMRADRGYVAYRGAKLVGTFRDLNDAVEAAMRRPAAGTT